MFPRVLNPSLPRDLETICLKCLNKEPHKRYGTAQRLADDLRLFLEGMPVNARPVNSIKRGWRWCRRHSALAALIGLVVLVMLSAPIVVLYNVMTIVNDVQNARGLAMPELVSNLHQYPPFLVTPVVKSRFEHKAHPDRKLRLAFALAAFGRVNKEYLVSQVGVVSADNTENLVNALSADREASLTVIDSEALTSTSERNWRRKSRLAMLALHLDDPELASDMCWIEDRPDPVQRTVFIDELPNWHGNLAKLANLVKFKDDAGLRSAMMLGTASISDGRLSLEEKQVWQNLAESWFVSKPDKATHSAAGWLLQQWHFALPEIKMSIGRIVDEDWFVSSQEQCFLRIPAGSFQ